MINWVVHHMMDGPEDEPEVRAWVRENIRWPASKPPAMVSIDDRSLTFTGEWPDMQTLLNFKPWNRKDSQ